MYTGPLRAAALVAPVRNCFLRRSPSCVSAVISTYVGGMLTSSCVPIRRSTDAFHEALARDEAREKERAALTGPDAPPSGSGSSWKHGSGGGYSGGPSKDRTPLRGYTSSIETPNPTVILVNAATISPTTFYSKIEPMLQALASGTNAGVSAVDNHSAVCVSMTPLLVRLFDVELKPDWKKVLQDRSGNIFGAADPPSTPPSSSSSAAAAGTTSLEPVSMGKVTQRAVFEWFRVERFIPVAMQMAADGRHLAKYSNFNRTETIVYVLDHVEAQLFRGRVDACGEVRALSGVPANSSIAIDPTAVKNGDAVAQVVLSDYSGVTYSRARKAPPSPL